MAMVAVAQSKFHDGKVEENEMSEEIVKVSEKSKILAEKYVKERNFGRAFSHYLVALKLQPDWKSLLKEDFATALCKWGSILDSKKRYTDLFNCYEQAIKVFPENEIILNNLGAHLLRYGLLKEASNYFRASLSVNPHFIRATHNLENVSNSAVERWHFRMLNDNHRNTAFRKAIIKKIKQHFDKVLDIGTGTGLLSLFCFEAGAKEIYACDSSPAMLEIADQVFKENGATGIKLIKKHSTEMELLVDIPQRVSLVVTETVDSGLLGEGILSTLSHAWDKLLHPPVSDSFNPTNQETGGIVIPFGATLYITGVECEPICRSSYPREKGILFSFENPPLIRNCQDYDTRDLKRVEFKNLTNTDQIININFNDPTLLKEIIRGNHDRKLMLKCTETGRLDCFAVWFDLRVDEDILLNSGPLSETSAWDQAIFLLSEPRMILKNEEIEIGVSFEKGKLVVKTEESKVRKDRLETSENMLRTLNCDKLMDGFRRSRSKLCSDFLDSVTILDSFPFPFFGLDFLVARHERFKDKLICFVPCENDRLLVNFLADKYDIKDGIVMLEDFGFETLLDIEEKFDVILGNFVEMSGELKDDSATHLKNYKLLLKDGGIILPEELMVMGQFIQSDWLMRTSNVIDDDVTCGYKVKDFINAYKVEHYIDLDSRTVGITTRGDPFQLFDFFQPENSTQISVPCLSKGDPPNGLLYWFRIRLMKDFEAVDTNDKSSIYNQAAFLFYESEISAGKKLNIIRNDGLFRVEVSKSGR